MERTLTVWWDMAEVGRLMQDRHGDLSFAYDPAWLTSPAPRPVSRSLPSTTSLRPSTFPVSRDIQSATLPTSTT